MLKYIWLPLLAYMLFMPEGSFAREAGWVPIPKEAWTPPRDSGARIYKKTTKKQSQTMPKPITQGATVYDRQPVVTEAELGRFLIILPRFREWTRQNQENAHPVVNMAGQPDFMYSQKAADWVKTQGIEPIRFFCIMGRMAAGLAIIEEGNDMPATHPKDMPTVAQEEISLVRRHLAELLAVAGQPVLK